MAASYHRSYSSTDQLGEEDDGDKGSSLPYHSLNLAEPHLHEGTTLKRYQSSGSGCCHVEERAALRMVTAWMVIVAIAVFVALVVEIITQEHVIEVGDIVSDHVNCSKIGSEILGLGGNAVDAAVAAGVCLAVAVPHEAGIGGGGVMLIYQHRKNKTVVIDFREASPSSLNVSQYSSSPSLAVLGHQSVGVPGLVAGLSLAWERYGSHEVKTDCCSWLDLVWPTYRLLQEGFQVTVHWNKSVGTLDSLDTNNQFRQFVEEGGYSGKGSFNANISKVVKQIAHDRFSFYGSGTLGIIGKGLVRDLEGHISPDDIFNYRAEDDTRTPLVAMIQNKYKVLSTPAPTAGPELMALLNTMEDIASNCSETYNSAKYLSRLREALESIGGYQALLGDPRLNQGEIPIANITLDMMDKVNKERWVSKKHEGPRLKSQPMQSGAHAAVMDRKDNYVSMVLSLGTAFGSQAFSQGILLNNALASFSLPGEEGIRGANEMAPGKRPLSSAAPVIAVDTQDLCGTRVVTGGIEAPAVAQVLGPVLLCSAGSLLDSQRGPRLLLNAKSVVTEEGMKQETRELLEKTEAIEILPPPYSTVNALEKVQDSIHGFSDKLRSGINGYMTLRPTLVQTDNVDYTLYG